MTATEPWPTDIVAERWQAVLQSIEEPGRGYDLAPWQPLPGEARLAFLAFRTYLDNDERSIPQVCASLSVDYQKLKRWASNWEWERRAECYDQWIDRQTDAARAELVRRVSLETAQAFSRLPQIINQAQSLVQGALNAYAAAQQAAVEAGLEVEHLSISQAMKLSDSMRALIEAQSRFLGTKVDISVDVSGTVHHQPMAPAITDVLAFQQGLADANLIDAVSIEVTR